MVEMDNSKMVNLKQIQKNYKTKKAFKAANIDLTELQHITTLISADGKDSLRTLDQYKNWIAHNAPIGTRSRSKKREAPDSISSTNMTRTQRIALESSQAGIEQIQELVDLAITPDFMSKLFGQGSEENASYVTLQNSIARFYTGYAQFSETNRRFRNRLSNLNNSAITTICTTSSTTERNNPVTSSDNANICTTSSTTERNNPVTSTANTTICTTSTTTERNNSVTSTSNASQTNENSQNIILTSFVQTLHDNILGDKNMDKDKEQPILQVISVLQERTKQSRSPILRLAYMDKDGYVCGGCLSPDLVNYFGVFQVGVIFIAKQWIPCIKNISENPTRRKVLICIRNFEIIGTNAIPQIEISNIFQAPIDNHVTVHSNAIVGAGLSTNPDFIFKIEEELPDRYQALLCQFPFVCDGTHCSNWIEKNGISFKGCVAKWDQVDSQHMQTCANACPFITKTVDEFSNSDKRFLLHYTYVKRYTNICGQGQRLEPPLCLLYAFRQSHPNPAGVEYKGFEPKEIVFS